MEHQAGHANGGIDCLTRAPNLFPLEGRESIEIELDGGKYVLFS